MQRNFKPSPERLSVAECSNRIALTEEFVFAFVTDQELRVQRLPKSEVLWLSSAYPVVSANSLDPGGGSAKSADKPLLEVANCSIR